MRLRHTPFLLLLGACDDPPSDAGTRAIEDRLARMEARLVEVEARLANAEHARSSPVETIPLELPRATSGGSETTATVAITLAGTRAFLDGRPVTDEELGERLREIAEKNPSTSVIVTADKDVPYERVIEAMDQAKTVGLSKIALAVRSGEPPAPEPEPEPPALDDG
jgi:biopolymer transport protein ExbD